MSTWYQSLWCELLQVWGVWGIEDDLRYENEGTHTLQEAAVTLKTCEKKRVASGLAKSQGNKNP